MKRKGQKNQQKMTKMRQTNITGVNIKYLLYKYPSTVMWCININPLVTLTSWHRVL